MFFCRENRNMVILNKKAKKFCDLPGIPLDTGRYSCYCIKAPFRRKGELCGEAGDCGTVLEGIIGLSANQSR
ncbi:MAG TPA: hypothetical protein DD735_06515 [Clostridiales bacterium]|nr:hypothetical protein [Clostridiales bacterium]